MPLLLQWCLVLHTDCCASLAPCAMQHKLWCHGVLSHPDRPCTHRESSHFTTAPLLQVLEVRPVRPGALVRIQAEGRLQVLALQQVQPFLRATVAPLYDLSAEQLQKLAPVRWQQQQESQAPLAERVEALKEVMRVGGAHLWRTASGGVAGASVHATRCCAVM